MLSLVIEQHGRGVYLLCERAENAVDLNLYPGLHRPLHCTASGKAILAHLPDERVDEIHPVVSSATNLIELHIQHS